MHLGYMRVSKADGSQALDLQRDALLAAGVRSQHLYEDLASGRRDDRPGLAACLKALREGDVLVVWKLDRLGRDLRHLINTVHDLTTQWTRPHHCGHMWELAVPHLPSRMIDFKGLARDQFYTST
jgi:DNA invertase Pin-like site-specific DNA recombinase